MANALVTGANRGIGLELCRQLAARGDTVFAACRTPSPDLLKLNVRNITNIDTAKSDALAKLASELRSTHLDLLINNAGILRDEQFGSINIDTVVEQFLVNSLGPLRVTETLRQCLQAGSKVAIITSRMGSIADNSSGGRYGYRMSKAAVNMAGMSLAQDLRSAGISVALIHPGYVRTDMTHQSGYIDTDESARGILERIDQLTIEQTGSFFHANGERLPW